jgi:hypothetical protein
MTNNFIQDWPAGLHRLAESIPGHLKRQQIRARNTISRLHNCVCSVSQALGRFFSQFSRNGLSLFVAIAILTFISFAAVGN